MLNYKLTKELLDKVEQLSRRKKSAVMKSIAQTEFDRCAKDVLYWLDEKQHPGIPYVYTLDPRPMFTCNLCEDDRYTFSSFSLLHHLLMSHGLKPEHEAERRAYFTELPTTRPFQVKEYMPPIIEHWLRSQFFAIEKSRDMMATWLMCALHTWDVCFHEGRQHIFQSETAPKTKELVIDRAYFIWRQQPKWLRNVHKATQTIGTLRSGIIRIPTLNSEIIGLAQGPDQIRQYHPAGVFQDEAAFQVKAGEAFAAIKPAIQAGGRFTAISSAAPGWFQLVCSDRSEL